MKKSILAFIIILMISSSLLAKLEFKSTYHEYNKNHQFDYLLDYNYINDKLELDLENSLRKLNNKVFDQVNSQSNYTAILSYKFPKFYNGLIVSYQNIYDHYPEYHREGDVKQNSYTTGYYLNYSVTDSLSLRGETKILYDILDDPNIRKDEFNRKGYKSSLVGNWGLFLLENDIHLNFNYANENKTNNYINQLKSYLNHSYQSEYLNVMNNISFNTSKNDIYTLVGDTLVGYDYSQTNSQLKDDFNIRSIIETSITDRFGFVLNSNFNKSNSRYDSSTNKNSKNLSYDFFLESEYLATNWMSLLLNLDYGQIEKDFFQTSNNRNIENIKTVFGVNFNNIYLDSLSVRQSLEKVTTNYPNSTYGLDNDLITEITQVSMRKMLIDRINLKNYFTYSKWEEVNISSNLSANNNIRTSYFFNPQLEILFGDKLLLTQDYTIKIDYDDYVYDSYNYDYDNINLYDRYYRQVSAEYKLEYNNSPIIAGMDNNIWEIPDRLSKRSDNLGVTLSYKYFANEAGDKRSSVYIINGQNKRNEMYLEVKKKYEDFSLTVKPQLEWGDSEIYELVSLINYEYARNINFLLRIKPKIDVDKDEVIYTVDSEISLRF